MSAVRNLHHLSVK